MTRAASVVKTVRGALEDVDILEPVLEGTAGEVRRKLGNQKGAELGVFALAKNLPEVLVRKSSVSRSLELKKMVLGGVQVDSMNASRALGQVRKNVVASRGDGKNLVLGSELQNALINASIFPGKSIDVLVVELLVLLELVVVVDTPVVVLVEESGQGQVGGKILNSCEERFGTNLGCGSLDRTGQSVTLVGREEIGRLGGVGINSLQDLVRQGSLGKGLLLATDPDIVGDISKAAVASIEVENGTILVLEIVTATRLESDTVKVEPGTPKHARQRIDVAVNIASSIVSEGKVELVLDVEVDNAVDAVRREEGSNRVDDRVVVGLSPVSKWPQFSMVVSYNHGEAVRHGDEVSATMLRTLLFEVAQSRRAQQVLLGRHSIFIILKSELAGVLAYNGDIVPAKALKTLASNLTKRGREVDEVDTGEKLGDVDVLAHGFNVPAGTTANLGMISFSILS